MPERNTEGKFVRGRTYKSAKTNDMNIGERRLARMEQAAIHLLENVLHRRRWSAIDKQSIADFLEHLVTDEIQRRALAEARKAARLTPH